MENNLTDYLGKILTICQSNEITSIKTPNILVVLDKLLIVQLSPIVVGLLTQAKVPLLGLFKELAKCMGDNVKTSTNEIYYEAEIFTSINAFKEFLKQHLINDNIFTDDEIQDILDEFNNAGGSALKISIEKMSGGQRGGDPWSSHVFYLSICFSLILLFLSLLPTEPPEVPKSNTTAWSMPNWESIRTKLPDIPTWFQRPPAANGTSSANVTSSVSSANVSSPECSTYPSYAELEILRLLSEQNASGNQQYLQSQQQQQTYDTLLAETKLLKEALGIITSNLGAMNSTIFRTAGDIKRIPGDFSDIRLRVSDLQSNIANDIELLMNATKSGILDINATSANITSVANLPSANITSVANLPSAVDKVEECIAPNKMVPALKDANNKLVDLQKRLTIRTEEVQAIQLLYGKATEQLEDERKRNTNLTIEVETCNAMLENATSSPSSAAPSSSAPLNNTSASEVINATGDYTMTIIFEVLIAGIAGGIIWKMNSQNKELKANIDAEAAKKAQIQRDRQVTIQGNKDVPKDNNPYAVPRPPVAPNTSNATTTRNTAPMITEPTSSGVSFEYPNSKFTNSNTNAGVKPGTPLRNRNAATGKGGKRRTRKHKKYVTKRRQLRKIRRTGKKRHRNSKKFRMNK